MQTQQKHQEESKEIVIDATNAVLGRLASFAAKKALLGNNVVIVNSEKAVIRGNRQDIIEKYKTKIVRGIGSLKGPHFPRQPEAIVKRTVRGMLKYKKGRGAATFKQILCFRGVPQKYENVKKIMSRKKEGKFLTIEELSSLLC